MIKGNKIYHEWITENVKLMQSLKNATPDNVLTILNQANAYKYRLIEVLGEQEYNSQYAEYLSQYKRLNQ